MSDAPKRIQRRRTKGWRMPEGAVYVGRGSKWGNPFGVDARAPITVGSVEEAVASYRRTLTDAERRMIRNELRGKTIMCWCGENDLCHGDVLLEIANGEPLRG